MKILVTGANGYLGRGVVDALLKHNHQVIAVDFQCPGVNKTATCIECNLFSLEDPYSFFGKPDVLVHMAWRDGFVHNSDKHMLDLSNHYAFLKKMSASGIHTICVMGTMHEVGFHEGAIDEDTPCHPLNMYGIAKNALRDATKAMCKRNGNTFLWLRGFYIVGNPQIGNSIFSKIHAANAEGKESFPFTTGKNQYDFIDYPDFCEQVAYAATQDTVVGTINICSGKPESLASRVERFIHENGYQIKLQYGAFPDRPYDSACVYGDDTKIQKILKAANK